MGEAARSGPALLRDRRFGPYVVGQWLTNTGNWFHNVAAGIVVFDLTGSNTMVGLVGGLQFVFTLLLAPVAGQLSDRYDRRRLLLGGQATGLAGSALLAVLVLTVGLDALGGVWPVFVATAIIGVGYAISIPTIQAFVPSLVPRIDLPQAIALNSVTFNLARAIGPGLAGLLVAWVGAGPSFGVNALSFAAFALVLVWLGRSAVPVARPAPPGDTTDANRSAWAAIALARSDRLVATVLLATVTVGFATDPVTTLAPALAARLSQPAWVVGAIGSAFGGGATLSAFWVARLRHAVGPRTQASVGLGALATGMAAAALASTVPVLLGAMAVAGAGFIQAVSQLNTTLQLHVEDVVRGRVMALWSVAFLGVRPIAAALDGLIADSVGVGAALALAALLATVGAVGLWLTRPSPSAVQPEQP
ncbi:MFS transporter [soil metagenome]